MPIEPMFTANPVADAWHAVTAPGGYEWWYFDAEDPAGDTQIVGILLEGFVFHPGYLRAIARYQRRPTKTLPPRAGDYPCAYLCVYRGGRIAHQFMTQYKPADFSAERDRVDVQLGENRLTKDNDGALRLSLRGVPWELTWQGPQTRRGQTLSADLTFRPRWTHPPIERRFLSEAMTGADHHWAIANPACDVAGQICLSGAAEPLTIDFAGRGYHDHNYGTGPLGPGLARWIWGRVIRDDRVLTFHYAVPRASGLSPEVHLVQADAQGASEVKVEKVQADWSRRSNTGLAFPQALAMHDHLSLSNPRMIDATPFYLRLQYDVAGASEKAFCEVAYPHRLRWPVLGRMIEMSFDKKPLR